MNRIELMRHLSCTAVFLNNQAAHTDPQGDKVWRAKKRFHLNLLEKCRVTVS